jgi:hypothetical protein
MGELQFIIKLEFVNLLRKEVNKGDNNLKACGYGNNCTYAHSEAELRPVLLNFIYLFFRKKQIKKMNKLNYCFLYNIYKICNNNKK